MSVITLTTDFGFRDAYVAAMKGVILGINPDVTTVDVCHWIEPQNVAQAAFLLSTFYTNFPPGTVHVVVIDPEVGGSRRAIVLKSHEAFFVAPDNGVLSYIVDRYASPQGDFPRAEPVMIPTELQAIEIANPEFWHHPVSSTFHGRDIFAPVAAHLSLGVSLEALGNPINSVNAFPLPRPQPGEGVVQIGHVLHIDGFGNVITDFGQEDLPVGRFQVQIAGQNVDSLGVIYADAEVDQLLALIGSSGYLEIAVRNGSAADMLGVKVGDEVRIQEL